MTVGELERGRGTPLSSRELTEWKVFFQLEAADAEARKNGATGANGGVQIVTMGGTRTVEPPSGD